MNEQQLSQHLHTIAEHDVPHKDMWRVIQQRVQPQQATKARRRMLPTTRLGWAAMAMMVLLPLGTALGFTLRDLYLHGDRALLYIEREGLNQQLDLQQTVDDFTFKLERVYADANRIVIGYTVSGDFSQIVDREWSTSLDLFDAAGNQIPGGEMTIDNEARDGVMKAVVSFDPSDMAQLPSTVRAVVPLAQLEPTNDPNHVQWNTVATATFDFPLPAAANAERRIVNVNQTVEANGIALTLKQVWITPTSILATVCGMDAHRDRLTTWVPVGTLATEPDGSDRVEKNSADVGGSADCHQSTFYAPQFYERGGKWTLTVTELAGSAPTQESDPLRTIAGPWTFTFDVPQP